MACSHRQTEHLVPGTIRPIVDAVIRPLGNSHRAELRSPHAKFGKTGAKFFFNFYVYCSTLFSPQYEGLCYSDADAHNLVTSYSIHYARFAHFGQYTVPGIRVTWAQMKDLP